MTHRILGRYDRSDTLFYLDPPYFNCETDYGRGCSAKVFLALADQLAHTPGNSLVDQRHARDRDIFSAYPLQAVETTYSVGEPLRAGELIISNTLQPTVMVCGVAYASPHRQFFDRYTFAIAAPIYRQFLNAASA